MRSERETKYKRIEEENQKVLDRIMSSKPAYDLDE